MLTVHPPHILSGKEGPAFWFLNNLVTVKATTASTGGAYSLCHQISPPGSATPYHFHYHEDEAFYILEGESTFTLDGKKTIAGPGEYLFLPRQIPHGIEVTGSIPTTMLIFAMPGTGFVGMMEEMGIPATERVLPTPAAPDLDKLIRLCKKYGIEVLGPIPA